MQICLFSSVGFEIDFDADYRDEAMVRGDPERRCFETKMTYLSQKGGFLRKERRDFTTFTHCYNHSPSFEEMQITMPRYVPLRPLPSDLKPSIVNHRELTREEYLGRF